MKREITLLTALTALLSVMLLGGCLRAEGGNGHISSYSEMKIAMRPLSPERWDKIHRECPRPNGIFKHVAGPKDTILSHYFMVEGFEIPATTYPGGTEDDEPLPSEAYPINLFGGEKNGVRQWLNPKKGDPPLRIHTLELRPLGPGRFRIGVTTTNGLSAVSNRGVIVFWGSYMRCEKGAIKSFSQTHEKKMVLTWELFVDPETGDIVVRTSTGIARYTRVGK